MQTTAPAAALLLLLRYVAVGLVAFCSLAGPAAAVVLHADDILVTDSEAAAVIRVDPVNGAQTVVTSGGFFTTPAGIAIGSDGALYVAQLAAVVGDLRAIVKVNPATGAQTIIASGGMLESMRSVVIDDKGRLLVAQGDSAVNGILAVDPTTGAQAIVSSGGFFRDPTGLAIEDSGQLLVVDQEASALIRVDPTTGAQTVVTSGGSLGQPIAIALEPGGRAAITNEPGRALVRTDLTTGQQTIISSGGLFDHPFGMARETGGTFVVANGIAPGRILRVDPVFGEQTEITSGGNFRRPAFVAIVPGAGPLRRLTSVGPVTVWIGLKNSDDVGSIFDLRADVTLDGAPVASGQVSKVSGGSSGFPNARASTITLTLPEPVDVRAGAVLGLTLSARITCAGKTHASGIARLWFNDAAASSRVGAAIDELALTYFLRAGAALAPAAGPGPRMSVDKLLDSKVPCTAANGRPFTSFGTWSTTLP